MKSFLIISVLLLTIATWATNLVAGFSHEKAERSDFKLPNLSTKDEALLKQAVVELRSGNLWGAIEMLERTNLSPEVKSSLVQYASRGLRETGGYRKSRSLLESTPAAEQEMMTRPDKTSDENSTLISPIVLMLKPVRDPNATAIPYKVTGICLDQKEVEQRLKEVMEKIREKQQQFLSHPETMGTIQKAIDVIKGLLKNLQDAVNHNGLASVKLADLLGLLRKK